MRVNLAKEQEVEKFYAIAEKIRGQFPISSALFSDTKNLSQISLATNQNAAFFIFEAEGLFARAGAYLYPDSKTGYIGWFESSNDQAICNQALTACVSFLKAAGAVKIIGPVNGSTFYNYRFNLSNDLPVFPGDPFQPSYYIHLWESFGFEKKETYISTYSDFPEKEMYGVAKARTLFSEMGLSFEQLTVELLQDIWKDFYDFLLLAFKGNQHFVPITFEEFNRLTKDFPLIHEEDYSYILFDQQRKPIGYITALIDVYRPIFEGHKVKDPLFSGEKLVLKTIAVAPEWQNKQLGTLLSSAIFAKGKAKGYQKVIVALMWEGNISAKGAKKKFDAVPGIHYALYKLKNYGK